LSVSTKNLKSELRTLDPKQLEKIDHQLERDRILSDLAYFADEYLHYRDLNEELHGEVIAELRSIQADESRIFLLPRGHLKTSLITIAWVIWQILKNQNIRIAIVHAAYSEAVRIMNEIKAHLADERLVKLFGEILYENPRQQSPVWREEKINVKQTFVVSGYTVCIYSIFGHITGSHYDIMIFDDIQDIENTESMEMIKKVCYRIVNCDSVLDSARPRCLYGGIKIFVGTRWHRDDAWKWLTDLGVKTMTKGCAVNSAGQECEIDDPDARPILPELWSIDKLKSRRKLAGSRFFALQYYNKVIADSDITFDRDWIEYYDNDVKYKKIWIMCDPAISLGRLNDDTVINVTGKPQDDELPLHCIGSEGIRLKVQAVVDRIFTLYKYYKTWCFDVEVCVEVTSYQYALKQWIEKDMSGHHVFFSVTELKPAKRPKPSRIRNLQPLVENKGIVFKRTKTLDLIDQMVNYDSVSRDDHVDIMAYIMDVMHKIYECGVITPQAPDSSDPYSLERAIEELEGVSNDWRDY